MSVLLPLLVLLIVGGVLYWAVNRIVAAVGLGEPVATILQVGIVVVLVLWALDIFGWLPLGSLR